MARPLLDILRHPSRRAASSRPTPARPLYGPKPARPRSIPAATLGKREEVPHPFHLVGGASTAGGGAPRSIPAADTVQREGRRPNLDSESAIQLWPRRAAPIEVRAVSWAARPTTAATTAPVSVVPSLAHTER